VNTASCNYGSNFSPFGSYYTTLNRSSTLSITSAVIAYPSRLASNCSFNFSKSSLAFIYSLSVFSRASLTASLTSNKSFANLVIANDFSSSIILRYRWTVISFSLIYLVYSSLANFISFSVLLTSDLDSSNSSFKLFFFYSSFSISSSYSLNSFFILLTSSADKPPSLPLSSLVSSFFSSSSLDYAVSSFFCSFNSSSSLSFAFTSSSTSSLSTLFLSPFS